jgi:hypothetical protein
LSKAQVARRDEILRDAFSGNPLFWNRSAILHFVLFGCRDHTIKTLLANRNTDDGKISLNYLEKAGCTCWLNATEFFARVDGALVRVLEQREHAG